MRTHPLHPRTRPPHPPHALHPPHPPLCPGRFYYRFPNGEAGTDVFDRTASFITYLFRTMSGTGYFAEEGERRERRGRGRVEERGIEEQGIDSAGENGERPADNYLLITHGLLVRALPRVHRTVWRCTVCAVAWAMHGHCMGTACAMHVLAHYTRRWGTAYLYLAHRPSCRCACSACATSAGRSPSSSRHCAALGNR